MKPQNLALIFLLIAGIIGVFYWALFVPKAEISSQISKTIAEQEKKADLVFKEVVFEEIAAGIKYWKLSARSAMINKSSGIATLKDSSGTFYRNGKAVLNFKSPAAIWNMNMKEILLDKPLGYDVNLEGKIASLIKTLQASKLSIFNFPRIYKKEFGYWFQANDLSWKLADQKLVCRGGIVLNKGEVTGYADKLYGDVGLEQVMLEGDPRIIISPDHLTPVTLEADKFEVLKSEDLIIAQGNPKIHWNEAVVMAKEMKYLQRDERLKLEGSVRITYKDIEAWGDSANYLPAQETILLEGNARARQGENKLSGEKVVVSLKDQKISLAGKGKVVITEEDLK